MLLGMPTRGREAVTPRHRDARGGRRNPSYLTAKYAKIAEVQGILVFFAVMIPSDFGPFLTPNRDHDQSISTMRMNWN